MNRKTLEIFKILEEAGDAINEIYFGSDFQTQLKSDRSPVTVADKLSSNIINSGLKRLFPDIPIIDEENEIPDHKKRKDWKHYFLIDPLDGTKEFISRNGEFCINLARLKDSLPDEGWIYQPLKRRGWYCKKGEGILEFDNKGNMNLVTTLSGRSDTLRIVASRSFFRPLEAQMIEEIKKHFPVEIIRRGSSLKQIDIILGNTDMYLKGGPCSEWDTAPGHLIIEESGGVVLRHSDFKNLQYNKENLLNPHFSMLGSKLNKKEFIDLYKTIIKPFYI